MAHFSALFQIRGIRSLVVDLATCCTLAKKNKQEQDVREDCVKGLRDAYPLVLKVFQNLGPNPPSQGHVFIISYGIFDPPDPGTRKIYDFH